MRVDEQNSEVNFSIVALRKRPLYSERRRDAATQVCSEILSHRNNLKIKPHTNVSQIRNSVICEVPTEVIIWLLSCGL
jgi:hypothetical protein